MPALFPRRWLGAVLYLCFAGCVSTVHPVYMDEDLIFEPALLGAWHPIGAKGAERAVITRTDTLEYAVVYTDESGQEGRFIGHLARIGGTLLFDMLPEPLSAGNGAYHGQFVATHLVLRIDRIAPTLRYRFISDDGLPGYRGIPELHGWCCEHGQYILTSSTSELQHLLTGGAMPDRALWTRPVDVVRVSSAPPRTR